MLLFEGESFGFDLFAKPFHWPSGQIVNTNVFESGDDGFAFGKPYEG